MVFSTDLFSQSRLFKKELLKGRSRVSFYTVDIPKNKIYLEDKIRKYAESKGYMVHSFSERRVSRFGDESYAVRRFSFLPRTEIDSYIFEMLTSGISSGITFEKLIEKQKVTAYIFKPFVNTFTLKNNIHWSGNVIDGKINGKGVGYYKEEDKHYVFKGTFNQGKLEGNGEFIEYVNRTRQEHNIVVGDLNKESVYVDKYHEKLAAYKVDGLIGFLTENFESRISPRYLKLLQPFKNGKAVVTDRSGQEIEINSSGTFIGFTEKQKGVNLKEKQRLEKEKQKQQQIVANRQNLEQNFKLIYKGDTYVAYGKIVDDKLYLRVSSPYGDKYKSTKCYKNGNNGAQYIYGYIRNASLDTRSVVSHNSNLHDEKSFVTQSIYTLKKGNPNSQAFKIGFNTCEVTYNRFNIRKTSLKDGKAITVGTLNLEKAVRRAKEKVEQERIAQEKRAREFRIERARKIKALDVGDMICYSQDWVETESDRFLGITYKVRHNNYSMKAVLIIDNINPNGKMRVIVNNVSSSNSRYYSTIKIGSLKVKEKDIVYFSKSQMLDNFGFQFCE